MGQDFLYIIVQSYGTWSLTFMVLLTIVAMSNWLSSIAADGSELSFHSHSYMIVFSFSGRLKFLIECSKYTIFTPECVVVVYHITIVAIGHGLLKKFWPMVNRCKEYESKV